MDIQVASRKSEMQIIFLFENLKRRNHSENLEVDVRVILKWALKK
jgi:hypothetical protein